MAQANVVQKKARMGHRDIIKYQIMTHCFMKDIPLSEAGLDCLTLLAAYGTYNLAEFCNTVVDEKIFKTTQPVRNFLTQAENTGLVSKNGTTKKTVALRDDLKIQTEGNIVLDFKMIYVTEEQ
jgi:hypothetical protein